MTNLEKEPTDKQLEEFRQLDAFGESNVEEFSGFQDRLGPEEEIQMMSTARLKGEDKVVICLTNKRLILFNSNKSKILGKRQNFDDIRLGHILDIEVDERKDFDMLKIETKEGTKKLMAPEGKAVRISGLIREQQEQKERDPAKQLERIGKEKERGNISEEEYQEKKEDLMDRI